MIKLIELKLDIFYKRVGNVTHNDWNVFLKIIDYAIF